MVPKNVFLNHMSGHGVFRLHLDIQITQSQNARNRERSDPQNVQPVAVKLSLRFLKADILQSLDTVAEGRSHIPGS